MFYPLYKTIKDNLLSSVTDLKDVQWFNDQYTGRIHAEPVAFIEFPDPVPVSEISKNTYRANNMTICVHLVSKSLSDSDNSITDDQVERHDELSNAVVGALEFFAPVFEDVSAGKKLIHTLSQADHSKKGWLVTKLWFTTKVIQ